MAVIFPAKANYFSKPTECISQVIPVYYSDTLGLDTIWLPEVNIKAGRNFTAIELGYYKRKFIDLVKCSYGLGWKNLSELYVYIENTNNNTCFLKAIKIAINKNESAGSIRFRLKKVDTNGLPGTDLIEFSEIFNANRIPNEFNIEHYNITMPIEGVFLGLEVLEEYERSNLQKEDLSSTNSVKIENTLRVKATCNYYKTKVYLKSQGTEEWIKGDHNNIPRIGLIVKEF